jgi:cell shape-determining protein MreD
MAIVGFTGALIIAQFFFPNPVTEQFEYTVSKWASLVVAFSMYIGMVNTLLIHGRRVMRRTGEWYFSAWLLVVLIVYVALGHLPPMGTNATFGWIYDHVQFPIRQTSWTLLCFFVIGASARVFRARNIEAVAMFTAVILVSFNIAPIYSAVNPVLPQLGSWVLDVPNVGGGRAMYITLGVGAMALGIRQMLGRERSLLGVEGQQ